MQCPFQEISGTPFCMLIYFLYKGNCRQFDLTLARMLSIVTTFLNVIQRNQYRGKLIIKRESCGINNFLQDQGSKFPSLLGSGIKILSEKMGSVMKKYTSLLPCCFHPPCLISKGCDAWVQLKWCG